MKHQLAPTAARQRQLLQDSPCLLLGWKEVSPSSLSDRQAAAIERLIELLDRGKRLLADPTGAQSARWAVEIDDQLTEVGCAIGAELRPLNDAGIYVEAKRGCEAYVRKDPESGEYHPHVGPVVRLNLLRREAAIA